MNRRRTRRLALLRATAVVAVAFFAAILLGQSPTQPARTDAATSAARRLATAERVCQMLHDENDGSPRGHGGVEHTYLWSKRRMEAQLDVEAERGDRVSAVRRHAEWMRKLAESVAELNKSGMTSKFEVASTQFYLAESEELLARAEAK